ncbi:hypothetical protein BU23DRAFT_159713 [Bimuria novae-zelandiae CBS 107.79]|uniref:Uncharacterized protein n=1 Tax=Bimuria novae-zelandiae CBS 107.79 TaxID=1447943 RepID=A0A6A5V899_9PLEO|nr:hypothetical protein BU23DRAFT_159713 [Bimuria novae-zelandiae CBS 107.79]
MKGTCEPQLWSRLRPKRECTLLSFVLALLPLPTLPGTLARLPLRRAGHCCPSRLSWCFPDSSTCSPAKANAPACNTPSHRAPSAAENLCKLLLGAASTPSPAVPPGARHLSYHSSHSPLLAPVLFSAASRRVARPVKEVASPSRPPHARQRLPFPEIVGVPTTSAFAVARRHSSPTTNNHLLAVEFAPRASCRRVSGAHL